MINIITKKTLNKFQFRSSNFNLDPSDTLSDCLTFAMLGRHPSNTTAWDSSLYNNNGTLTNMPAINWYLEPDIGRIALKINTPGTIDNKVLVPDSPSVRLEDSPITLSAWVYRETPTATNLYSRIFDKKNGILGRDPSYYLGIYSTDGRLFFSCGNNVETNALIDIVDHSAAVPLHTWTHIAGQATGTVQKIFLNGVEKYSENISSLPTADTFGLYLGNNLVSTRYFQGRIADCMIHSRALTPSEIQRLAATRDPTIGGWIVPDVGRRVIPLNLSPTLIYGNRIISGIKRGIWRDIFKGGIIYK